MRPRRSLFLREARHEERSLVIPNKRRETQHREKTGPARRVARQMVPCGVAGLAKGLPLPASRALPGTIWRCNAACDETGKDPRCTADRRRSVHPLDAAKPPAQAKLVKEFTGSQAGDHGRSMASQSHRVSAGPA